MKKLLLSAVLSAVLVSACARAPEPLPSPSPTATAAPSQTPTASPAPTPHPRTLQATWLEVDDTHRFWVELKETDEPSPITKNAFLDNGSTYTGLRVDIYERPEDEEPVQSFLTGYNCRRASLGFDFRDWNFDGYTDLAFKNLVIGSRCRGLDFYLWDPEAQVFVPDPYGLNTLNHPELHPEEQVITSLWPINGGSETYRHYRYRDGKLTLTRECQKVLNFESETYSYSVEEWVDGNWQTVFDGTEDPDAVYSSIADEYLNWRDQFDYPPTLWGFPIDLTHDAFEVDTGGKLGTVLVTVEIEDIDPEEYHFSVWTKDDLKRPMQTMAAESYGIFHWNDVADVNFDSYMDFGYMYAMGNQPMYWHYWIWDEGKGQFVQEPEFDQISCPQFDKETGVISGWMRTSCCSGVYTYHRWEEGKLVCIRRITMDYPYTLTDESWEQVGTVEDRIDGKLVEVYREVAPANMPYYEFEHLFDWQDLDYHG